MTSKHTVHHTAHHAVYPTGSVAESANVSHQHKRAAFGFGFAISAYSIWGMYPFFWMMVLHVPYLEIFAHRMIWSMVIIALFLPFLDGFAPIMKVLRSPKYFGLLALNSALITLNWGLYIYSLYVDRLIESSLGYYMSPIFASCAAMIFLGERLRQLQYIAVALMVLGIAVAMVFYGQIPWISLGVSVTFALYSTIRRKVQLSSLTSLGFEVFPVSMIAIWYLSSIDGGMMPDFDLAEWFWVILTGVITVIPLTLFGLAVNRAPLMPVALLFYIVPTCLFFISVFSFGEPFESSDVVVFCFVWSGLGVYFIQALRDLHQMSHKTA